MPSPHTEMHMVSAMHFLQPFTHRGSLHQSKQANKGPFQPRETVFIVDVVVSTLFVYPILIFRGSLIRTRAVVPEHCRSFCSLGLNETLLSGTLLNSEAAWNAENCYPFIS